MPVWPLFARILNLGRFARLLDGAGPGRRPQGLRCAHRQAPALALDPATQAQRVAVMPYCGRRVRRRRGVISTLRTGCHFDLAPTPPVIKSPIEMSLAPPIELPLGHPSIVSDRETVLRRRRSTIQIQFRLRAAPFRWTPLLPKHALWLTPTMRPFACHQAAFQNNSPGPGHIPKRPTRPPVQPFRHPRRSL